VLRIRNVYIRIPDHDFYQSRIPNSGYKTNIKSVILEKNLFLYLFCKNKFTEIKNAIIYMLMKKLCRLLAKFYRSLTQKFCNNCKKIWVLYPWSQNQEKPIPDPGFVFKGQECLYPGSRICILKTGVWYCAAEAAFWATQQRIPITRRLK
jgi:hypothetical protein